MVFAKSSVLTTTPENARKIGVGVLDRVGNTPLLRLERVGREYPQRRNSTLKRSGSIPAAR